MASKESAAIYFPRPCLFQDTSSGFIASNELIEAKGFYGSALTDRCVDSRMVPREKIKLKRKNV